MAKKQDDLMSALLETGMKQLSKKLEKELKEKVNQTINNATGSSGKSDKKTDSKKKENKTSGKTFERKQYRALVRTLKKDDVLFVKSIDRLGRNYTEIIEQWRKLTKVKKCDVVVLDMPLLDTRRGKALMGTFLSDIVLQVLSFVAENERTNIKQRQAEGIAAAKAQGIKFGRPPLPLPDNFYEVHKAWRSKKITLKQAAEACNMPVGTFYGKARKFENVA